MVLVVLAAVGLAAELDWATYTPELTTRASAAAATAAWIFIRDTVGILTHVASGGRSVPVKNKPDCGRRWRARAVLMRCASYRNRYTWIDWLSRAGLPARNG
ncbi:hypothetical protein Kisp01_66520 [Kineosporia sp. NBRC 101677]|nr:hypothetical protein Kisp01_66520 [Kineosporia sp. NBRC 101677]